MKVAYAEEKHGLQELWWWLKARHSALGRAESARKKRSQMKKNQERFFKDPFQFSRQLFQQPSLDEVKAVVLKARAKSTPGPNGVPYLLYKRCPNVLKRLHKILRRAWNDLNINEKWMTAEGVYIPKGLYSIPNSIRLSMEVILKAAEGSAGLADQCGGCYMPLLKASMKDTRRGLETTAQTTKCFMVINRCGLHGLRSSTINWWSKTEGKEKRDMVINEMRLNENYRRGQKAVQQSQQGQWADWDNVLQKSLKWNDIWQSHGATLDQLPP
ncbi:hypothetical protein EGW08_011000 [Elysia chlorotica]|uniref:Reverse transcriptase domain-containing protein n=1 Tax=Elysia chlorotica TaxID=188477 RepID=A0A3S0ZRX1_ELYCH|nr:hypothetical protein EGW08_011000 [Elysia chlorotica]